jgi:microcystin-dependent protein
VPSTSYIDFAHSVAGIANRTDAAGAAVLDISAEELRLALPGYSEGAASSDAFLVQVGSGMGLTVGSGAARADRFVVAGQVAGQADYTVRLDAAPVAVTVPAADASQARTDEVYLVVADAAYDAGALSLPRLGYRRGDAGGGAPGPDAAWKASALLATVAVPAGATSIAAGDVTDTRVFAHAPAAFPTGMLMPFAGAAAPDGWLLCQGQAVSRTTYRRLFRAIGTAYGAGDGSTTFLLPDARNRVLVGAGSSYVLGATGGAATVTLTTAQIPSHTHDAAVGGAHGHTASTEGAGSHAHDVQGAMEGSALGTNNLGATFNDWSSQNVIDPTGNSGHHSHSVTVNNAADHDHSIASTGGGGSHENMPPYLAANLLIKT